MNVIIYADFNCPYSYLASLRVDLLVASGAARIEWRAVEHDRWLARTGTPAAAGRTQANRELAEVSMLAWPGERLPSALPAVTSNTEAAVAAYAEAVADGMQDELRRRLFHAIFAEGRHLSSAYDVRRVITDVMWPADPILPRLSCPELPGSLDQDPDLTRIMRRSGGTIAPDGTPVTTVGYQRIRQWRQGWLALPQQVVPAVIGSDGTPRFGAAGLGYLAELAARAGTAASAGPIQPRSAVTTRQRDRQGQQAGRAV